MRAAEEQDVLLWDVVPEKIKATALKDAESYEVVEEEEIKKMQEDDVPIKITSFEGAKGLSAQHVFIAGLHDGDLPRDGDNIQDLEVCRFVVGLTRTKKKCSILISKRFAKEWKKPSPFIFWIKRQRYDELTVDAQYWKENR